MQGQWGGCTVSDACGGTGCQYRKLCARAGFQRVRVRPAIRSDACSVERRCILFSSLVKCFLLRSVVEMSKEQEGDPSRGINFFLWQEIRLARHYQKCMQSCWCTFIAKQGIKPRARLSLFLGVRFIWGMLQSKSRSRLWFWKAQWNKYAATLLSKHSIQQ